MFLTCCNTKCYNAGQWRITASHTAGRALMAFISYVQDSDIPERDRVADDDNIIRIHGVHSRVMRHHFDLYLELMRRRSPLTRRQREMIAVVVSSYNDCHY